MADRHLYVVSFFLKEAIDVALHILSGMSFQFLGASKVFLWPKVLTGRSGTVGTASLWQGLSGIALWTTVEKFINKCCSFEHAGGINKQSVESL